MQHLASPVGSAGFARRSVAAVVVALVLAFAVGAAAQDDRQRAGQLATEAASAAEAGRVQDAIRAYQEALSLVPDPSFAFNLGVLHDGEGNLVAAWRSFSRYLQLFPGAPDRADIESYVTEVGAELVTVATQVAVTGEPAGAQVWLVRPAGVEELLGTVPLETFVEPGTIQIEIRREGYVAERERFNGVAGLRFPISVALERAAVAADPVPTQGQAQTPTPTPTPTPNPVPQDDRGISVAGIVLTSVGVLSIGGGILGVLAAADSTAEYNELVASIKPGDSNAVSAARSRKLSELDGDIQLRSAMGWTGIGVGAVITGVGLYLLLREPAPRDASVSWQPLPGGGMATFGMTF